MSLKYQRQRRREGKKFWTNGHPKTCAAIATSERRMKEVIVAGDSGWDEKDLFMISWEGEK
jgi:hypothetical protein